MLIDVFFSGQLYDCIAYDVDFFNLILRIALLSLFCITKMQWPPFAAYGINTQFQGDFPYADYRIFTDGVAGQFSFKTNTYY